MSVDVKIIDNSGQVKEEMQAAVLRALERMGGMAQAFAMDKAPVDTGNLRDHIHTVISDDEKAVYIGTKDDEVPYAGYVELGTYKMRAQPFLKPAASDHALDYLRILEDELKG